VFRDADVQVIVGQIVGGHPDAISIVQDMEYLLEQSNTTLRPWP